MATAANPCSASFLSKLIAGNEIVCSPTFSDFETSSGIAQIQNVVDNAASAYGEDSATASAVQNAATIQEAQVPADTSTIDQAVAASTLDQFFTTCDSGDSGIAIPGLPCIAFKWLALGAGALVLLYFLAIVSSFVPRPR